MSNAETATKYDELEAETIILAELIEEPAYDTPQANIDDLVAQLDKMLKLARSISVDDFIAAYPEDEEEGD